MKNIILFLFNALILFSFSNGSAQNLVPNPSFENYNICPSAFGELYQCQSWSTFGNSPDYFNACSPDTIVSVPKNDWGFQYAATGNAYGGFINLSGGPAPPQEYLGAQLLQPLTIGQRYYASFKVSIPGHSCASNKMGIRFSTIPFDSLNQPPLDNNAHVYTDSIISDTTNWYQIKGSFIADSNYAYVVVGNFFNTWESCFAGTFISYYYIDDICVSTDSSICGLSTGIPPPKQNVKVILFPNPFSDQLTFTLADNWQTTVSIYDFLSRQILQQSFTNSTTINTEQLADGIYFYRLHNESGVVKSGKVVKQ